MTLRIVDKPLLLTMENTMNDQTRQDSSLKEIPKWADRYARHRVLAMLVGVVVFMGAAAIIGGLSAAAGVAWQRGHLVLAGTLLAADLAFCAWWVWLVLSRRLNTVFERAQGWLYRGEGEVAPAAPPVKPTRLNTIVGVAFAVAVCATPILCDAIDLPTRYLQPLTAIYLVPFTVYLCYQQRRFSTSLMLLWPALYTLHTLLVLAGVPLLANLHPIMAVLLPMIGYELIALLSAHLYSRYALHRLRTLARVTDGQEGHANGGA